MLPAKEAMTAPLLDPSWLSFAVALDAIGAAVYLKDAQGRYVFANEATERALGVAAGSVVGRQDAELLDPNRRGFEVEQGADGSARAGHDRFSGCQQRSGNNTSGPS